jgi:delta(3,5)-delta(2,4)-dienoyl-CoA isomerase
VNAFNTSLWRSLASLVIKASRDPDVKVVVLSSSLPKIFTAGLDFQDPTLGQTGEDPARTAFLLRDHILEFQGAISELEKCAKPVIAAMHGLVLGLGVDIASACDIRLASEDARFSIKVGFLGATSRPF